MTRPRTGRTERLVVYLTPTELAAFERRRAGADRQAWARAALLGDEVEVVEVRAGRPPRRTPEDQAILDGIARDAREIMARAKRGGGECDGR